MNLQIQPHPLEHYPAPVGAHGLAWSYLLDNLFADAYARNIANMVIVVPHAGLVTLCERRAYLSRQAPQPHAQGTAFAQLSAQDTAEDAHIDRFYNLEHGLLAPRNLRTGRLERPNWQVDAQLFVLTWQVKLWGAAMKLANQAQRPQLADRATFAMRRHFASARPTPSFYILRGWSPLASVEDSVTSEVDVAVTSERMMPSVDVSNSSKISTTNSNTTNINISTINKVTQDG
ncbi:MAG: hypothetical protein AAF708_16400 [Deinococcota bacterium]